jgi:hypothetical protein
MRSPLVLGASLVAGFCVGQLVHRGDFLQSGASSEGGGEPSQSVTPAQRDLDAAGTETVPLLGTSEGEAFPSLPEERQKEVLSRLSARLLKGGGTGDMLLLAKLVGGLSFEQAAGLWEQLPAHEGSKSDPSESARNALAERLASMDPSRVLQMGSASADPRLARAAVVAMAQKNGADAIRALAQMPEKFQASVAAEMRGSFNEDLSKASGTIGGMAAVLKENPQLLNPKSPSEGAVRRILGQVASRAAAVDPAGAMAEVRRMAADVVQVKPGEDPKAAESAFVARIGSQMTKAMRSDAPVGERAVFNALADSEKNEVQVALEAAARFRSGGVEEAIQFAEKQGKEQFTKNAAGGVWWSLSQLDRPAAMQWIETLPQGAFREGALNSLMQEALFRSRSWGDSMESIRAGNELLSRASKLDYYAQLAGQTRGPGISKSEFIASLPLPEADKSELRRRMAPIRAK